MFKEIGSNFWLDPEQLDKNNSASLELKYINEKENVIYSSSGRSALSLLLTNIKPLNNNVLIPLYTCDSVILPFKCNNNNIHFYDINSNMSINEKSFFESIEKYQPGIIFLISYFGFDTLSAIRTRFKELREMGITIIEDITQSLFSKTKRDGADYYVASIRKWLAIPDGGMVISTKENLIAENTNIHESFVNQNIKAMSMKFRYTNSLDTRLKNHYRKLFHASEELLYSDCSYYGMSGISKTILSKTNFDELCNTRRSNYKYLFSCLKSNPWVTPVFSDLPDNVVPLYLPVYIKCNREKIQGYLANKEIYAPVHWPIPGICRFQLTSTTSYIYNSILSIPCDQRYNQTNINRIITALKEYKG